MSLILGTLESGKPFHLPDDAVTQTFAFLGVTGAGKSTAAAVMLEEMHARQLPFVVIDPGGTWWGMRAGIDGKPAGGLPVVVFGGQHADLPLERTSGAMIAAALMGDPICAVLDLSQESKRFWHTFVTDFCLELMKLEPRIPRHFVVEEASEFLPQKARQDLTARCKEAMERLVRAGRNHGYGVTLLNQRAATVDKDCLTQCQNVLAMRLTHNIDRKALRDWCEDKDPSASIQSGSLSTLPSGQGYFWSPAWLGCNVRVTIRQRRTFHPGATRKVGRELVRAEAMADVGQFVTQLKGQLAHAARQAAAAKPDVKKIRDAVLAPMAPRPVRAHDVTLADGHVAPVVPPDEADRLEAEVMQLRSQNSLLRIRLSAVRTQLAPQYQALCKLFEDLDAKGGSGGGGGVANRAAYEPWLAKAGRQGCRRLLEVLLDRPELTRNQLATLGGVSPTKSTFRAYMAWLKSNGLVTVDGDTVKLQEV